VLLKGTPSVQALLAHRQAPDFTHVCPDRVSGHDALPDSRPEWGWRRSADMPAAEQVPWWNRRRESAAFRRRAPRATGTSKSSNGAAFALRIRRAPPDRRVAFSRRRLQLSSPGKDAISVRHDARAAVAPLLPVAPRSPCSASGSPRPPSTCTRTGRRCSRRG
jgi:hypothetical protein